MTDRLEVDLGLATDLRPGDLMLVPLRRDARRTPRAAIVLRDIMGRLRAYLNRCEHLPIPLNAGGGDFLSDDHCHLVCHTHGALYRVQDGYCEAGPCLGASLQSFEIYERDGRVILVDRLP